MAKTLNLFVLRPQSYMVRMLVDSWRKSRILRKSAQSAEKKSWMPMRCSWKFTKVLIILSMQKLITNEVFQNEFEHCLCNVYKQQPFRVPFPNSRCLQDRSSILWKEWIWSLNKARKPQRNDSSLLWFSFILKNYENGFTLKKLSSHLHIWRKGACLTTCSLFLNKNM